MKVAFVLAGAFLGLFPIVSMVLIGIEILMIFLIARKHGALDISDFLFFSSKIVIVSFGLKYIAHHLHFIIGLGQIANSLVAAVFIFVVYELAEAHYSKRAAGPKG